MKKIIIVFLLLFLVSCCTSSKDMLLEYNIKDNQEVKDAGPPPPPPPPSPKYYSKVMPSEGLERERIINRSEQQRQQKAVAKAYKSIQKSKADILKEEFDKLKNGKIAFKIPEEMGWGLHYLVEANIGEVIEKAGKDFKVKDIKVGATMTANLKGEAFTIKSIHTKDEQPVIPGNITKWSWDVSPLTRGTQNLILVASVRIQLPDKEETYDLPVIIQETKVRVVMPDSIVVFLIKYWQYFLGTLVIPPIVWWIKRRFKDGN